MLTSKAKIRVSLLIVASISLITSLLSLNYMNQIIRKIEIMTDRDAKMAGIGEELSIKMLEARREEKNFIIFLDSTHIHQNLNILGSMEKDVELAYGISDVYHARLDSISELIVSYRQSIQSLAQTFQEDPRAFYRLQQQLIQYEKELDEIADKQQIVPKDLPSAASNLNYALFNAVNKISADKAKVITQLKDLSTAVLLIADSIVMDARQALAENSAAGRQYGVRARRNILTLLMVTTMILAYLIYVLPVKIFDPFRRIQRALKAISRGETDFPMPSMDSKDEIGELSRSFHEATRKIRYFNELITKKVIETRRNYQRILDEVNEGVIIADTDFKIVFINQATRDLFQLRMKSDVKSIKEIVPLWETIESSVNNIEKMGRTDFHLEGTIRDIPVCDVTLIPRPGKSGRIENVLFIIRICE